MPYSIINHNRYLGSKRMDAIYHHPDRIISENLLSNIHSKSAIGNEFSSIRTAFHPEKHGNKNEEVTVVDLEDVTNGFINHTQQMKAYQLGSMRRKAKSGDLLISRLRSYLQEIAIVPNTPEDSILCSPEFIILRPKREGKLNVQYLYTYLHTKYVQTILACSQEGTNHPRFSTSLLLDLLIPIPPNDLLENITELVNDSLSSRYNIEKKNNDVKEELKNELKLKDGLYSTQKTCIVDRSKFLADKRLDAEYFSPNYMKSEEALASNPNSRLLKELAKKGKNRLDPTKKPNEDHLYIDISNVDPKYGDFSEIRMKGYNAPSRARKKPSKGDVLVSTVRPNRNAVCIIDCIEPNTVCSTGFSVIHPVNIDPYFLYAQLKNKQIYNQLVRRASAAMYPAVSEDQIFNIRIIEDTKGDLTKNLKENLIDMVGLLKRIKANNIKAISYLEIYIKNCDGSLEHKAIDRERLASHPPSQLLLQGSIERS